MGSAQTGTVTPGASELRYVADPATVTSLTAVLAARAEATPDAVFVTYESERRTFAEAFERARAAAAGLAGLGVRQGDRVAFMLPNCLELLDIWLGCALLGAVIVSVNPALKGDGLRYIIEHSEAKVLVSDATCAQEVARSLPAGSGPALRFVRRGDDPAADVRQILDGTGAPVPIARVRGEHAMSVLYTSGTTGLPKGVVNCHNSYVTAALEFARNFARLRYDDVIYTALPLFHVNAQMLTVTGSLVSGRPIVLAPRFSASGFFDDISRHGATIFHYVGPILTMLAKQPPRDDDGANPARLGIGGAAPPELWQDFERRFGVQLVELYGLTETACVCIASPPDDVHAGKIGRPVSWAEAAVHRPDGSPAGVGEPGEIVVRSTRPHVLFDGYLKNTEATAAALRDGWFHTGDRGRIDPDGHFVFLDRLKDTIRRRGENISSYEVERTANLHPAVAESAAIGVPSELGEEEVMLVVVRKPGHDVGAAELRAFCAERIAAFMLPRYVQFRDALPKTATHRVQKFLLRADGVTASTWDAAA